MKNWEICAQLEFKTHYQTIKNSGINFRGSHINTAFIKNYFYKKLNYKQNNWANWTKNG